MEAIDCKLLRYIDTNYRGLKTSRPGGPKKRCFGDIWMNTVRKGITMALLL